MRISCKTSRVKEPRKGAKIAGEDIDATKVCATKWTLLQDFSVNEDIHGKSKFPKIAQEPCNDLAMRIVRLNQQHRILPQMPQCKATKFEHITNSKLQKTPTNPTAQLPHRNDTSNHIDKHVSERKAPPPPPGGGTPKNLIAKGQPSENQVVLDVLERASITRQQPASCKRGKFTGEHPPRRRNLSRPHTVNEISIVAFQQRWQRPFDQCPKPRRIVGKITDKPFYRHHAPQEVFGI